VYQQQHGLFTPFFFAKGLASVATSPSHDPCCRLMLSDFSGILPYPTWAGASLHRPKSVKQMRDGVILDPQTSRSPKILQQAQFAWTFWGA